VPGPVPAHAVTDSLRREWPEADDEQWEYAALMAAASASRDLVTVAGERRRVVVAADVAAEAVVPAPGEADPTLVTVTADVSWRQVAAALVDVADDAADDDDLAWFATQEIPGLP
jgi:hypothetical protein